MKKMISLLLALIMVFAFSACSSGPELLGTYETEFDLTELIVTEFDGGAGFDTTDMTLGSYLDSFTITLISEFKEDGTYAQYIDTASLDASMDNLRNAVVPVLDDFMLYTFAQEFSAYGYNIETREDVEAVLNMEWDSIFYSALGMSMEEMVDGLMETLEADLDFDGVLQEGNYEAKDGKLYLSDGLEYNIDETMYETYEIDGDTVTITGGVNIEEDEFITYPYIMTKIS